MVLAILGSVYVSLFMERFNSVHIQDWKEITYPTSNTRICLSRVELGRNHVSWLILVYCE